MDQPDDDEAWLLELAGLVDEGRPIDWAQVEAAAGPQAVDVVRALRVIEAMAMRGRPPADAVQSAAVTVPPSSEPPADPTPVPAPPAAEAPQSDRYRSVEPSPPEEIRRKLLFGVALVLAMASVYVGLLIRVPALQYALAGLAVLVVLIALVTGAAPPPPPSDDRTPPGGPTA